MVLDPRNRQEEKQKPILPFQSIILFLLILAIVPFIELGEDGKPKLSKRRKEKLAKELDDLNDAEQYALKAEMNGQYPCFSCRESGVDSALVFLHKGEVWKYGVTRKGETGRYRNSLEGRYLEYHTQFVGTLQDCLKQEKIKIYHYPLLPESQKRDFLLIRPPGNKRDD